MFKILIADDDKDMRENMRFFLEKLNYDIIEASNGIDALEKIKNDNISIALIDWLMPGLTGIELCKKTRELNLDNYVYIIIVTGKSEKEDTLEALHHGADDYIVKPFSFKELKIRLFSAERIIKLENKLKEAYARLYNDAIHDFLTGVLNRRSIMSELESLSNNPNDEIGIIIIDIDNFKKINDTYGHLVGDEVLKEISNIISKSLRKDDYVGRYGGEEFLVILPKLNINESFTVAERIRNSIANHNFHIGDIDFKITVSLGVSSLKKFKNIKDALNEADKALYVAKRTGKNKTVIAENK
ncbi:signal transduction response regulator [Deferribacter desulfuricans SSM1]|uniref:diguanylate cyclase n=1 Tax=Deferribacter desulfuricans (strain DSM 14783 / JCM 11476 / NBRC 101012 / SSM1) TaxID=639282 RepID=D3PC96_DEFDS|nr:diguanylate cyclase [Deferribacter desulfuricans]BAI80219.1 signal transduction response regulator [Deferribacter desulfuricans SSM1]